MAGGLSGIRLRRRQMAAERPVSMDTGARRCVGSRNGSGKWQRCRQARSSLRREQQKGGKRGIAAHDAVRQDRSFG